MDPNFCTEEKTTFYDENLEKTCDNWSNDLFEDIDNSFDAFDTFIEQDVVNSDPLSADQLGLAMAFGEFASIQEKTYDVDENTDEENWENAMNLCSLQDRHNSVHGQKLAVFEQYINDITSGKCKGPWDKEL